MDDSNELHSEENKTSQDNNKKRKLKTPAQLMALEEFYNEHKYPTEEMKLQLVEELGLSEKQISGWFCHRRLKDKRSSRDETCANGRQDRSSGVIPDRASGLGQDSCGSTKHGDHRYVDPREVESRRLSGHDFPAANITPRYRSHYRERVDDVDNTSSESYSSLQDRFSTQNEDPDDEENSRYLTHNGLFPPINPKGTDNMGYKPSGYLKVKGDVENAAITAVRKQLGRHYQEDGPLLGVEFDLLPPGAFEYQLMDSVHEPSTIGNFALHDSPDISGVKGQLSPSSRYEVYNSQLSSQDLKIQQANLRIMHGFDFQEKKSSKKSRQKSTYVNHTNSSPGRNTSLDIFDKSAGGTSAYNSDGKDRLRSKQGYYGRKVTSEQTGPWLDEYDKVSSPKSIQRHDYMKSRPSSSIDKKLDGESMALKDYMTPHRVRMNSEETAVAKQARVNVPQRDYAKNSVTPVPSHKNHIKGTAIEMPSSFSEDETADTNSSED